MYQVVGYALALPECRHAVQELRDVPVQAPLGLLEGAGLDVNDPGILAQLHYLRVVGIVHPRVYVGPVSPAAQLSRDLEKVYVHSPSVALAQPGKRTAMDAQQGDAVHALVVFPYAWTGPPLIAAPAPGWALSPDEHSVDLTVLPTEPVLVVLRAPQEVEDAIP